MAVRQSSHPQSGSLFSAPRYSLYLHSGHSSRKTAFYSICSLCFFSWPSWKSTEATQRESRHWLTPEWSTIMFIKQKYCVWSTCSPQIWTNTWLMVHLMHNTALRSPHTHKYTKIREAMEVQGQGELFNGSFCRVRRRMAGLLLGKEDAHSNPGWRTQESNKQKTV